MLFFSAFDQETLNKISSTSKNQSTECIHNAHWPAAPSVLQPPLNSLKFPDWPIPDVKTGHMERNTISPKPNAVNNMHDKYIS